MASLNPNRKKEQICLASCAELVPTETDNIKRVPFKLKCPGSILNECEKEEHFWNCEKCKKLITRDFHNNFYCDCGKAKHENFVFSCSSNYHGLEFLSFPPGIMNELIKDIPEVNILVIGVVEEDTAEWLNTLVNSIAFPTMQEAIDGHLISMSPYSFNVIDMNDVRHNLKFGTGIDNQMVRANSFLMQGSLVRIVDVPGFRKCSEIENVKKHFQYLLQYLVSLNTLHGVCFLPRVGSNFELCFQEFLNYFDLSVIENSVFCVKPHESAKMRDFLPQLIRASKQYIPFDATRLYNTYNDCFKYICAMQRCIEFNFDDANRFSKMWKSSVEETERLMAYLKKIKPHDVELTLSMMETRKTVIYLSKAISIAIENIIQNVAQIKCEIDKYRESKKVTHIYISNIEIKDSNHQIICRNPECSNLLLNSYSVCHDGCVLDDATLEFLGDPHIKNCLIMGNSESLYCGICGCFWNQHAKIAFSEVTSNHTLTDSIRRKVYCSDVSPYVMDLECEKRKIMEISIKIGHYLTKLSLKSFNDEMLKHMESFINRERGENTDSKLVANFIAVRDAYVREEKLFLRLNVVDMEESEFEKLLNELYTFKWSGKQLKQVMELKAKNQPEKIQVFEEFLDLTKCVTDKKY